MPELTGFELSRKCLMSVLLCVLSLPVWADQNNVEGRWRTLDDETGEEKSIVELYIQDGELYGKVVRILPRPGVPADPVCEKCTDHRKDQKILGMVIIDGLQPKGDVWQNGTILDPAKGKTYECKIWLEDGALKVRGYVGILFRTQTWQRVES